MIPEGIKEIGEYAFSACSSLEEVSLPNSLGTIKAYAFGSCLALKEIQLPETLEYLGSGAFSHAALVSIEIPILINEIPDQIFYNCTHLSKVTLPEGLKSIGYSAFCNCQGLIEIDLPSTLDSISWGVFQGCKNLESVLLPQNLKKMEESTFYNCESLKSICIPDSLKRIEDTTFGGCTSLYSVDLGESLQYIGESAFSRCLTLKEVIIPESMDSIARSAFSSCTNMSSISIGKSISYIGQDAFSSCVSLASISIKAEVPPFTPRLGLTDSQFKSTILTVPLGCSEAFSNADIWQQFTHIEESEFLEPEIFEVDGITYIELSRQNPSCEVYHPNSPYSGSIAIPSEVEWEEITYKVSSIHTGAFNNATDLKSLSIPATIVTLGGNLFNDCTSLEELTIEDCEENLWCEYNSNETKGLFTNSPLKELYLGRNLSYVSNTIGGYSPFANISSDFEATIGPLVTVLQDYLFYNCQGLYPQPLGDNLRTIGTKTFSNCKKFTEVTLPGSLVYAREFAFEGCENIQKVIIEDNYGAEHSFTVGQAIFYGDHNIKEIWCYCETVPVLYGSSTFYMVDKDVCTLYVPALKIEAYRSSDTWNGFKHIKAIEKLAQTLVWEQAIEPLEIGDIINLDFLVDVEGTEPVFEYDVDIISIYNEEGQWRLKALAVGETKVSLRMGETEVYLASNVVTKTVKVLPVEAEAVELSLCELSLYIGDQEQLTATVLPTNTTYPEISWSSDNPSIAKMDGSMVTAVSEGQAIVTASCGNASAQCTVTVMKREQRILWNQEFEDVTEKDVLELTAETTSGLPVYYIWITDETSVRIEGNLLTVDISGQMSISANQDGNEEYSEAEPVRKSFVAAEYNSIGTVEADGRRIYCQNHYLELIGFADNEEVTVYTIDGALWYRGSDRHIPVSKGTTYIIVYQGKVLKIGVR